MARVVGGARAVGGKTRRAGVRDAVLSKWARIVLITAGSSMLAMTLTTPPQRAQVSMSTLNSRFRRCAQRMARWCSPADGVSPAGGGLLACGNWLNIALREQAEAS